eukprot:3931597-Rhodomonas_salina.2
MAVLPNAWVYLYQESGSGAQSERCPTPSLPTPGTISAIGLRACYALSGACYGMSGTDVGYGARDQHTSTPSGLLWNELAHRPGRLLHACDAVSGTDLAYGGVGSYPLATRLSCAIGGPGVAYGGVAPYARTTQHPVPT